MRPLQVCYGIFMYSYKFNSQLSTLNIFNKVLQLSAFYDILNKNLVDFKLVMKGCIAYEGLDCTKAQRCKSCS